MKRPDDFTKREFAEVHPDGSNSRDTSSGSPEHVRASSVSCDTAELWISACIDGESAEFGAESAELASHVAGCSVCRARLEEEKARATLLRTALSSPDGTEEALRQRVVLAAREQGPLVPRRRWRSVVAAVALFAGGFTGYLFVSEGGAARLASVFGGAGFSADFGSNGDVPRDVPVEPAAKTLTAPLELRWQDEVLEDFVFPASDGSPVRPALLRDRWIFDQPIQQPPRGSRDAGGTGRDGSGQTLELTPANWSGSLRLELERVRPAYRPVTDGWTYY